MQSELTTIPPETALPSSPASSQTGQLDKKAFEISTNPTGEASTSMSPNSPHELSTNDVIEVSKPQGETTKIKLLSRSGKVDKTDKNK